MGASASARAHRTRRPARRQGCASTRWGMFGAGAGGAGPARGARVRRLGDARDTAAVTSRGPRQAHLEGFDLHANVWVSGNDRTGLERLCRYILRPPFAHERLRLRRRPRRAGAEAAWHDGTRELVFEPLELLERLAAMTPRPEMNLLICHGLLAARARWRARVVAYGRRGARAHGLGAAAGRGCGGHEGEDRFARLELGGALMYRASAHPINCNSCRTAARADPGRASLPSPERAGARCRRTPAQLG